MNSLSFEYLDRVCYTGQEERGTEMAKVNDEEMAALLEKATDGEWRWGGKLLWADFDIIASGDMDGLLQIREENAEFIVAAKAWIPQAIARLRELETE